MNIRFKVAFLVVLIACPLSGAQAKTLLEKTLSVSGKTWVVLVDVAQSKPKGNGMGFCGSGQEVTFKLREQTSKSIAFSKLIESCLHSIELQEGQLGSENAESLSRAIQLEKYPIEIRWLTMDGKSNVVGRIDLLSGSPKYSESSSEH
jgi:hypothetical protein